MTSDTQNLNSTLSKLGVTTQNSEGMTECLQAPMQWNLWDPDNDGQLEAP